MSAERYRVTEYQHSGLDFLQIERGGSTHELCAQTDDSMIVGAIRQQSADIAELRAELAAAVAERDMLSELAQRRERQLSVALNEVEQLRAFRQAIDSAPVVAHIANKIGPDYFPYVLTILADSKLPPLGTDLIAKPAKD